VNILGVLSPVSCGLAVRWCNLIFLRFGFPLCRLCTLKGGGTILGVLTAVFGIGSILVVLVLVIITL
jgi:hypothetical protein